MTLEEILNMTVVAGYFAEVTHRLMTVKQRLQTKRGDIALMNEERHLERTALELRGILDELNLKYYKYLRETYDVKLPSFVGDEKTSSNGN